MAANNFESLRNLLDIQGVNRYNPNNISTLEACVEAMIKENKYDKDILTTLLKLYQLNQESYNEKYVLLVLLKTLMAFPRNDYGITKYLIDSSRMGSMSLRRVFFVGQLLESCNFSMFWKIVNGELSQENSATNEGSLPSEERLANPEEIRSMIEKVNGFKDAVRNYACQVIHVTYQTITKRQLRALLGGLSITDSELTAYARGYGWEYRAADDSYFVQNHEDTIKSRNIEERLRIEQCMNLLRFRC